MRFRYASLEKKAFIIFIQIIMIGYVVLILYPLFNMIMSSFKSTRDIMRFPFSLPKAFDFSNYVSAWVDKGFSGYFLNSLYYTLVSMAFVVLFGSMAAFGVSRYIFKGNTLLYMLFLSGIMLPLKAAVIPLFQIIKGFGIMDSPLSVIFIFIAMGIPSTVFILSGFMKTIPAALEQAARIDGASELRIYSQIVMPICMPSVALVVIYNAVPIWNEFFFPLVFLQKDRLKTLPVGLSSFIGQHSTNWALLFTGLSIAIVPMLLMYLFMSKYFIKGMTAGAVK
ncbi:MAG: carbohydrate ABC transporter permease [Eubacteriales bacterium]|jgi:raffinose/stachyose/melibiose transport system permease protein|nr:carbohydrate ABC transporter permease [Eubacteriales bacterium]MDD4105033.1 carbohydrate ABC transporter permease [Eubacteriales bacterium]MDD4710633.1 carbohydrate ABC transporter permease [Eubacteriales bacterium]NLO14496.1 carbohydrate ABC transporter permease [Clostridiales bacterium]